MSKPSKNKEAKKKAKTTKPKKAGGKKASPPGRKSKGKRPEPVEPASKPAGKLIALEGIRGRELEEGAKRFCDLWTRKSGPAGYSLWDASNTFYELRMGKAKRAFPPPRTLLLLYASDLMFRLRWEIRPALSEGTCVAAAPYVETAVAFGVAAGLPADWLRELFAFAPKPDVALRLKEKNKVKDKEKKKDKDKDKDKDKEKKSGGKGAGFVEFCAALLEGTSPTWTAAELRVGIVKHFDELEDHGEFQKFGKKLPKLNGPKSKATTSAAD